MTATITDTRSYDAPAADRRRPGRQVTRWAALAAVVLLVLLVGAFANRGPTGQRYDTAAATPDGSRALAAVLAQRGITVQRVPTADAAVRAAAGRPVTVVVPDPDLVPDPSGLASLAGGRIVLVDPDDDTLGALSPRLSHADSGPAQVIDPSCSWPAAQAAGRALVGGSTFDVEGDVTASCYAHNGAASLVVASFDGHEVVALGSGEFLRNRELADEGNAALAVNLLSAHDTVLWLLPHPGEIVAAPTGTDGPSRPLTDYLPDRVVAALWTVVLAVVLLALAYGRRLGRVVTEPLPVVVRAAETVEGKARLYRAARARDRAAGWLRDAALHELRTRAGLPADATPPAVVDVVGARTGRSREDVAATLYGPAPQTDRDLVALADALDSLTAEVRRL
ncbi:MAG: hypothetical protein QOK14_1555 [Frankiaceae bacterium]|nr:hypothetical protein [Frankiaceae bacterium]